MHIRLTGEGNMGVNGGPPGDLYIHVSVKEHNLFRREGDDLIYELLLNIAEAALGTTVEVPILEEGRRGEHSLRIPAGTQSGQEFVIRGKGVPHLRRGGRGDLITRVSVGVPTELTEDQRQLLAALGESLGTPSEDGEGILSKIKGALG